MDLAVDAEQAGLWFGSDDDNYVKVVFISSSSGTRIQARLEVDGDAAGTVNPPSSTSTAIR